MFALAKLDAENCNTHAYRLTVAGLLFVFVVHGADVRRATYLCLDCTKNVEKTGILMSHLWRDWKRVQRYDNMTVDARHGMPPSGWLYRQYSTAQLIWTIALCGNMWPSSQTKPSMGRLHGKVNQAAVFFYALSPNKIVEFIGEKSQRKRVWAV